MTSGNLILLVCFSDMCLRRMGYLQAGQYHWSIPLISTTDLYRIIRTAWHSTHFQREACGIGRYLSCTIVMSRQPSDTSYTTNYLIKQIEWWMGKNKNIPHTIWNMRERVFVNTSIRIAKHFGKIFWTNLNIFSSAAFLTRCGSNVGYFLKCKKRNSCVSSEIC